MIQAICILVFFLLISVLMMTRKLPSFIALIFMAIGIALIAGVPLAGKNAEGAEIGLFSSILEAGASRMSAAMLAVLFGAWCGRLVTVTGVSKTLITKAAELGGDRPLIIALVMYAVLSFLWTNLTGLGSMIMTGTIAIPILTSVGLPSLVAGGIFLMAVTTGFNFNLYQWQTYIGLTGVTQEEMSGFAVYLFVITVVVSLAFIFIEFKRKGIRYAFAAKAEEPNAKENEVLTADDADEVQDLIKGWRGALCMLTPIVPLVMVMAFKLPIIPAFMCGIIWIALFSAGGLKKKFNLLVKTAYRALVDIAPVIFLLAAIGILYVTVTHPVVKEVLQPMLTAVMPTTRFPFILFFAILAPLSLYRGPLNLFGMGSGIAALLVSAGIYSPTAVMGGFVAVERLQSVGCPTNTQNVWTSGYIGADVNVVTKYLLPYLWIMAVAGSAVAGFLYM